MATGVTDISPQLDGGTTAVANAVLRFCPICDGYEAMDKNIVVFGPLQQACAKALFLRTYSKDVAVIASDRCDRTGGQTGGAGVRLLPGCAALDLASNGVVARFANGEERAFDVLYPALGCEVHSELASKLGAKCTGPGLIEVDARQQTSVEGLYAAGDVVSDLHQLSVAEGHAAIAATAIHNRLPHNFR
jgi:thioredoxin reductase (NADPH)